MKKLRIALLFLGILSSCSDSEHVGQDYPITSNERIVRDSCGRMNKLTDLLDHNSFKWAMVCWGWHLDYPEFYAAVQRVDPDSWNHIMGPLNQFFFNNRERRDNYLRLFNELDRARALDDLASFFSCHHGKQPQ